MERFKTDKVTAESVEPDEVIFDCRFGKEESTYEPIAIDAETGRVNRTDMDRVNSLEKRIARTTKRSLFFPTFRRIEGGFSKTPDAEGSDVRVCQYRKCYKFQCLDFPMRCQSMGIGSSLQSQQRILVNCSHRNTLIFIKKSARASHRY